MIRQWIKRLFHLYDVADLQAGGWCGCCGNWLGDEVVVRGWPYTICRKCRGDN